MFLEHATGEIELRLGNLVLDQVVSRSAMTTPAGVQIVVGDGGWDPATLTLQVRVSSPTTATPGDGALAAVDALVAAAKTAIALREAGDPLTSRVTYLHGLALVRRRLRPLWWEVDLGFHPRALDGIRGTGEVITYLGDAVTYDDVPVHMEVH